MSPDTPGVQLQRLLPSNVEERLVGYAARAAGAGLLAAAVFGWLSLLTWTISDPSLSHTTSAVPRNLLGAAGALVSDLFIQTLGFAAVFALLAPVVWGLELAFSERVTDFRIKSCLMPVSVLAMAGGFSALPTPSAWPLHHGLGGILGDVMYTLATNTFAILNPERAGLAAGLTFFAAGLGAATHSIGLSLQDLAGVLWHGTGPARQPQEPSLWMPGAPAPKEPSFDESARRQSAEPTGWTEEPSFEQRDAASTMTGNSRQEPALPLLPRLFAERFGPAWTRPASAAVSRDRPNPESVDEFDGRDTSFDVSTEHESRSIAERFAPANAPPRPGTTPRGKGLLGGLGLRRPAAAAYKRPSLNLLKRGSAAKVAPELSQTVMRGNARLLEDVLADFGIKGTIKSIRPGPVVTLYELEPARGTKSSRVIGLADDIARSMSVASARVAVVPGRNAIGIELPNVRRETVLLRELLETESYKSGEATLPLALGKSIDGDPVLVDLARMPHLLVAGTTGSGKSVGINAMILSLLYRLSPEDCRMIMIDPKMLELSAYNGIPHLLTPVITDPQRAIAALEWAVTEMEERYKRMAQLGVRSIDVFNNRVRNAQKRGERLGRTVQTGFDQKTGKPLFEHEAMSFEPLPYIVVVIDEFADLMVVAGKDIEAAVQRLAQMARAAGIHLIMATQRPSVDIITGTIKANFPTRVSFKVASKIDSRTILNEHGAEQLLGHGDMLYASGSGQMLRVHGALVLDEEVEAVTRALREQGEPQYIEGLAEPAPVAETSGHEASGADDLYDRAVAIVIRDRKASTSYIQRRLQIGYNRAADLIERMERDGIVGAANHAGKREIRMGEPGDAGSFA